MRRSMTLAVLFGSSVLAAAACDGRGRAPEAARPVGEAAALPAGPAERSEGEEFAVEARHDAEATVGQATTAVFVGTGRDDWHVNPEYPAKLEVLAAEGFTVAETVLRVQHAARFDEQQLRFDVPLTPTRAGELPVQFKFKFGLCSGDRCVTREATLGWTYAVGGG
ncbi:MAG: hypothetical protein JXB32_09655 [Deltaproteobacteria bacterium]|nr:hypothetical protein [Deltaproteobacteria bacterium]